MSQKKHPFSIEEDIEIMQFVATYGTNLWGTLGERLNRTTKQVRERWHGHLNPSVNKGPWTRDEDEILIEKQASLGNKWAEISRFLPGRTDTAVKNRWNTSLKRQAAEVKSTIDCSGRLDQWLASFDRSSDIMREVMWEDALPPLVLGDRK